MKDQDLNIFFLLSTLLHLLAIPVISMLIAHSSRSEQNIILIDLVAPAATEEKPKPVVPLAPPAPKIEKAPKPIPPPAPAQRNIPTAEELQPKKDEPEKPIVSSSLPGGGNEKSTVNEPPGKGSGAGNLFGSGNVAVVPGGDLGKSGAGRGEGPPGPGIGERRFRAAKPIQMAKASYPPMALRMGLEADVSLKVFVDAEGRVTKAEIVKNAGMGFDDEALKAVRQYRFEPAVNDGKRVASEFTYIYRFRMEK